MNRRHFESGVREMRNSSSEDEKGVGYSRCFAVGVDQARQFSPSKPAVGGLSRPADFGPDHRSLIITHDFHHGLGSRLGICTFEDASRVLSILAWSREDASFVRCSATRAEKHLIGL